MAHVSMSNSRQNDNNLGSYSGCTLYPLTRDAASIRAATKNNIMRFTLTFIAAICLIGCKKSEGIPAPETTTVDSVTTVEAPKGPVVQKTASNQRFREVFVTKTADGYEVTGQAQVFEASFSWVVEDGHNELASGHQMTDAGAPEWGKFRFVINPEKEQQNSTLTLILFEASAKDGSRQYELPIALP